MWQALAGAEAAPLVDGPNVGCRPGRGAVGALPLPGPRYRRWADLSASGLLLSWLHRQRSEGGGDRPGRVFRGRMNLPVGDPFVEPGPRTLPDLVGGDIGPEHRIQSTFPVPCALYPRASPPSQTPALVRPLPPPARPFP